jgi:hypothetical protein
MTTAAVQTSRLALVTPTSRRTNALAERLEQGARALATLARTLSDEQWQTRIPADAPLTCQFLLEDHPVRHSYHHLARIHAALESSGR